MTFSDVRNTSWQDRTKSCNEQNSSKLASALIYVGVQENTWKGKTVGNGSQTVLDQIIIAHFPFIKMSPYFLCFFLFKSEESEDFA